MKNDYSINDEILTIHVISSDHRYIRFNSGLTPGQNASKNICPSNKCKYLNSNVQLYDFSEYLDCRTFYTLNRWNMSRYCRIGKLCKSGVRKVVIGN